MPQTETWMVTRRTVNSGAERWLHARQDCLDHGYVTLVDYMGDDARIVDAARTSYGKGTRKVQDDRGLIRYLMRHGHTTPFEKPRFEFAVKLPIFVARQWMRHRMGSFNEYSLRYSEALDEFYVPEVEHITAQDTANRQGGTSHVVRNADSLRDQFIDDLVSEQDMYRDMLATGMRRELARIELPLAQYTQFWWTVDLHNLLHFLALRLDPHAQYEIRVYGEAIARVVRDAFPLTWEAFEDFRLHAVKFSSLEMHLFASMIESHSMGGVGAVPHPKMTKREWAEYREKVTSLITYYGFEALPEGICEMCGGAGTRDGAPCAWCRG